MRRATDATQLVSKLRASRLGEGFAAWVERNWAALVKNERLQQTHPDARSGGGTASKGEAGGGKPPARTGPTNRSTSAAEFDAPTMGKAGRPTFEEQYAK